jgi:hypothetical protein
VISGNHDDVKLPLHHHASLCISHRLAYSTAKRELRAIINREILESSSQRSILEINR